MEKTEIAPAVAKLYYELYKQSIKDGDPRRDLLPEGYLRYILGTNTRDCTTFVVGMRSERMRLEDVNVETSPENAHMIFEGQMYLDKYKSVELYPSDFNWFINL